MHNPIHPLEGSRPYYPAFCRLMYFVYMSIYIYDNFYRPTLWMSVTFTDLYRLLSVVTCFLISACEAVCVCVSVRNSERCCWLTVILGPAEGRGSPQRRTGTDVSLTWPLLMTEGRERGLFIIVHTSRLIYKAKFRWFTGKWLFKCIDIWWWWCFCDCVNTCVTLLFLQNHQRPDFFGIFSLAQDSIVACEHSYILQKIQPLTHTVKSEPSGRRYLW